jgi:predicted transposase YdaD
MEILGGMEMIPLEQLRESSTYQYILQEGRQEGRQEGLEEGRQEGLEEGEQKGKIVESRHTLTKLIAKRFPDLNLQAEIESIASLSILEELCLQVLDAANSAEMQQWVMEKIEHK